MFCQSKSENYNPHQQPQIIGGRTVQPARKNILDISDYLNLNMKHSLGQGSAGKVLKVYDFELKKEQAIKLYEDEKYFQTEQNIINSLPKGLPVLKNLDEKQQKFLSFLLRNQESVIPKGYRFRKDLFIENRQRLALIMDVYDVNLAQFLYDIAESELFDMEERIYLAKVVFAKIFLCVYHLHQNGLIHCDISLDNFLVLTNQDQETLQIFINDFNHTKFKQNAIINSQQISGKHFPPEVQITGPATCVIHTQDHTINAKRLDFFSLFCVYYQIFGILKIPKEQIDSDTEYVMRYFYYPLEDYEIICQHVIDKIFNLHVDEEFMRYLLVETYDYPDCVQLINFKENAKLIDIMVKLQEDKRIFEKIQLNYQHDQEKNLLQFNFKVFQQEEQGKFNENNQQQQLFVDQTQREYNAIVQIDLDQGYLCFSYQTKPSYLIQQGPQWFERFKKLVLQAIGPNNYENLPIGLNQQQYQQQEQEEQKQLDQQ
ncbi:hypothetical protein ABPG74_002820 [Tetrahymena malaccensis]